MLILENLAINIHGTGLHISTRWEFGNLSTLILSTKLNLIMFG